MDMLNWFKRRRDEKPAEDSAPAADPVIAAVLMKGDGFPLEQFRAAVAGTRFGGHRTGEFSAEEGVCAFSLADEMAAVAAMPAPYPWSDLEGPCSTAWMWPEDKSPMDIKQHRSHVLVMLMGGRSAPVERRLMLTQLASLAAQQPGAQAVYWPEATLVHYPPLFIDMARDIRSPEAPPLYLWVDYRLFDAGGGRVGLFTTGLSALGHMEIEIPGIEMDPGELREWTLNISYYLLEKGPVLKNGDTIGMTPEHKVRIRHRPSKFGHPGNVLRFEA
jgi:hypothetical protein